MTETFHQARKTGVQNEGATKLSCNEGEDLQRSLQEFLTKNKNKSDYSAELRR
jgi:hypothetical protein